MDFLRSKKGKIAIACLLAAVLAAVLALLFGGKEKGYRNISISEIFGSVMTEANGKEYEAYQNMRLSDGYILTTDSDSYTRMLLDSDKYVKLEQESRAAFEELGTNKSRSTVIRLEKGALTNEITVPLEAGEEYTVNTPNSVLSVRGTYFRVEVREDINGDSYTNVYTYGGKVACKRVMPDGSVVEEEVIIDSGYKACIRMDEIVTVYVEEQIVEGEEEDNVDPIDLEEISDWDMVDIYNASANGHRMFMDTESLWDEVERRNIDVDKYNSAYGKGRIERFPDIKDRFDGKKYDDRKPDGKKHDDGNSDGNEDGVIGENDGNEGGEGDSDSAEADDEEIDENEPDDDDNRGQIVDNDGNGRGENDDFRGNDGNGDGDNGGNNNNDDDGEPNDSDDSTDDDNVPDNDDEDAGDDDSSDENDDDETDPEDDETDDEAADEEDEQDENTDDDNQDDDNQDDGDGTDGEIPDDDTNGSGDNTGDGGTVQGHVHYYGEYIPDNNATCTADGTKTATCVCGKTDTIVDEGTAKGHIKAIEKVEPTFAMEGLYRVYCSVCGETLEREIIDRVPALYLEDGSVTITETGYTQGGVTEVYQGTYTISQRDTSIAVASMIKVEGGTHNVVLDGINIDATDLECAIYIYEAAAVKISGRARDNILYSSSNNCGLYTLGNTNIVSGSYISKGKINPLFCEDGTLEISGGNVDVTNAAIGVMTNGGNVVISGGTVRIGGTEYVGHAGLMTISGGVVEYMHNTHYNQINIIGGTFRYVQGECQPFHTNGVDPVYCNVLDSYPDESELTFTRSDGVEYTYNLSESDKASDGKYYVWLPEKQVEVDGIAVDSTNFPDEIFRNYVSTYFDSDGNGYLNPDETAAVTEIDVNGEDISSLEGIGYFENLDYLCCNSTKITELDISGNTALAYLYCSDTAVSSLDLSSNTGLKVLYCIGTDITRLDVTSNIRLLELDCSNTGITALDLSNNPALKKLYCGNTGITTLDVSNNTVLETLCCGYTKITNIDVSNNTVLETLYCGHTKITNIDVSNNTVLEILDCSNTELTNLDVSNNQSLKELWCGYTGISALDVSQNAELESLICNYTEVTNLDLVNNVALLNLHCDYTKITTLDVSNNISLAGLVCDGTEITNLDVRNNTKLTLLSVYACNLAYIDITDNVSVETFNAGGNYYKISPDATYFDTSTIPGFDPSKVSDVYNADFDPSTGVFTNITGDVTYTYDCGQGYSEIFTLEITVEAGIAVDSTNFPDDVFREYVSTNFDSDSNGLLSDEEISAVTEIDVSGSESADGGVASLAGVEHFVDLQKLYCSYNSELTALDLNENVDLVELDCICSGITNLDISKNTALTNLYCSAIKVSELDVSKNTALKVLVCTGLNITNLDLSENTELEKLNCLGAGMTSLDLSNNIALSELNCSYMMITSLDLSNNTALTVLSCDGTGITSLDLSNNIALKELSCTNILEGLDVSNNKDLTILKCSGCNLAYIDLTNNSKITTFIGNGNSYVIPSNAKSFDTSTIPGFDPSKVSDVYNADFDSSTGVFTNITGDVTYTYDCGQGFTETFTLARTGEAVEETGIAVDSINFPDDVFREYVSTNFDSDSNGLLSDEEIVAVTEIDVAGTLDAEGEIIDGGIASLSGVNYFTELATLHCQYNSGLTELDVNDNTTLTNLECNNTNITALDTSKNTSLKRLYCNNTGITSLDLKNNTILAYLNCGNTGITSLDVSNNSDLMNLSCGNTEITNLDVGQNTALTFLGCSDTGITSLDVSQNVKLSYLSCCNTGITSLDLSNNTALSSLYCFNTAITGLKLYDSNTLGTLYCYDCALAYVDVTNNRTITTLTTLRASGNQYPIPSNAKSFDTSTIPGFDPSKVSDVYNADFDPSTGIFTNITGDVTYTYDCGQGFTETFTLARTGEAIEETGIAVDSTNFPDDVFREYVSTNFDSDTDGYLNDTEIAAVTEINVANSGVTSLTGIENFTALANFDCRNNAGLTSLDVSNNGALTVLRCENTGITEINVGNNFVLEELWATNTGITTIDISNNAELLLIDCSGTGITYLDVSNNINLKVLYSSYCSLAYIDVSNNVGLTAVDIVYNKYVIPSTATEFDTSEILDFDPYKVSDVTGADFDPSTGIFTNITGDITYTYDCGQGYSETFTLTRTG